MSPAQHPLAPLTADELDAFRGAAEAAGLIEDSTRFAYVMLEEPSRVDYRAYEAGAELPRLVSGLVMSLERAATSRIVVDVASREIVAREDYDPVTDGLGPIIEEDFAAADEIVKADPEWRAALERRGITDFDTVFCCPLSAGAGYYDDEAGRRLLRVLSFRADYPGDSPWAHPIDGIIAHIDLIERRVIRLVEMDQRPIPETSGDYNSPEVAGPTRESLKPISITQPEGVSFRLEDHVLEWEGWSIRLGFNGREGLTLHDVRAGGRKVLHRASVSEMVVPYGDPTPMHGWQNYFDAGEYQFGNLANALELGCDCLGDITYLDAVVADAHARPQTLRNAVCIHEEDAGILWKHNESFNGSHETRRNRRLVVSFFVTIGNYDYGFYWYFGLDGTVELEAKATGIVFTSGLTEEGRPYATEIAPGLGAPVHQHLFSARLEPWLDGEPNAVEELDAVRLPISDSNPWGNAFTRKTTRLTRESEAQRLADTSVGRVWRILSTGTTNHIGEPPSFHLEPQPTPVLLAADDSPIAARAAFARKHLWVTRDAPGERWAAGYLPNQHPGGAGLPAYAAADRGIDGEDIVVWHTFGLTHFPRLEDWPIMPVDKVGFKLRPHGFFDRNPSLDVPDLSRAGGHCACGGEGGACACGDGQECADGACDCGGHGHGEHAGHAGHEHRGHGHHDDHRDHAHSSREYTTRGPQPEHADPDADWWGPRRQIRPLKYPKPKKQRRD